MPEGHVRVYLAEFSHHQVAIRVVNLPHAMRECRDRATFTHAGAEVG